jgi:hypothetical protein
VPLIQATQSTQCPMLLRVHHVVAMANIVNFVDTMLSEHHQSDIKHV